ncbi:MAG: hypothetical protein U1A27_01105 [Phycisphaerae bacterium]
MAVAAPKPTFEQLCDRGLWGGAADWPEVVEALGDAAKMSAAGREYLIPKHRPPLDEIAQTVVQVLRPLDIPLRTRFEREWKSRGEAGELLSHGYKYATQSRPPYGATRLELERALRHRWLGICDEDIDAAVADATNRGLIHSEQWTPPAVRPLSFRRREPVTVYRANPAPDSERKGNPQVVRTRVGRRASRLTKEQKVFLDRIVKLEPPVYRSKSGSKIKWGEIWRNRGILGIRVPKHVTHDGQLRTYYRLCLRARSRAAGA